MAADCVSVLSPSASAVLFFVQRYVRSTQDSGQRGRVPWPCAARVCTGKHIWAEPAESPLRECLKKMDNGWWPLGGCSGYHLSSTVQVSPPETRPIHDIIPLSSALTRCLPVVVAGSLGTLWFSKKCVIGYTSRICPCLRRSYFVLAVGVARREKRLVMCIVCDGVAPRCGWQLCQQKSLLNLSIGQGFSSLFGDRASQSCQVPCRTFNTIVCVPLFCDLISNQIPHKIRSFVRACLASEKCIPGVSFHGNYTAKPM